MDVLSDVLASLRLGSAVIGNAALPHPWGIAVDPTKNAAVHVLQSGECWLHLASNGNAIRIGAGDVILVAAGIGHRLSNPVDAPVSSLAAALSRMSGEGGESHADEVTTLLCARYLFDEAGPPALISLLPPLIHLTREQVEANEPLRLAVELLRTETSSGLAGHEMVAPRLLDVFLVLLLRAWIQTQPTGTTGWFGALRDKGIAQALRLIHERPARRWTVAELADGAVQSRATFARRFLALVGVPPLAYVTHWRISLAAKALRESGRTIHEVGLAVGYDTAPSFSKAFSRLMGQTPGRYRNSFAPPPERMS
ncbi:cupin domain-containing protein [Bosea sp. NPDC055332]